MSTSSSNSNVRLNSLPANLPGAQQDGHFVQLYTDDGFLLDILSRFIGGALAVGDGAVVIATKAHQDGLAHRLKERGIDTGKAVSQRRYVLLDASETLPRFMLDGSVDENRFNNVIGDVLTRVRKAAENPESRVAVFGELVALLWADGKPLEALRVEELWNRLAQKHSFSLLCAYPITGVKDERHIEPFLKMCAQHSNVSVPSESYLGLSNVEERLRTIAHLQEKAQLLEHKLSLQDSEHRFRLLVEAVQGYAIFMLDPDGYVKNWNNGAKRIKGYESSEIIGKHFSCFYPEEDLRNGKPQWELQVAAKEGRFEDEGWRVRKDGSKFWANVIITAIRNDAGELIGFGKVTRDFTERMQLQRSLQDEVVQRREAEAHLQNSEQSLRELSLHLLRTQDEERRRIGRDLHDSLGQSLAALKIKLDTLASSRGKNGDARSEIAECLHLAQDSLAELRTISYLMYPPMLDEMGLQSAIRWYLEGFSARSGISTTFEVDHDFGRMQRDLELALFRVLQESLTNVHRHSGSQTAHIRLRMRDGAVIMDVTDRGKGIPPDLLEHSRRGRMSGLGVGLRGMDERMRQLGGSLEVVSSDDGATVTATVPTARYSSAEKVQQQHASVFPSGGIGKPGVESDVQIRPSRRTIRAAG